MGHNPVPMSEYYLQTREPRRKGMNYSTAVMLINQNIRAITVTYEPDSTNHGAAPQKRTVFKTLDKSIAPGDLVIVPTDTRHLTTVVKVDEVDVDVNFESDVQIGWIIDKVSVAGWHTILAEEEKWIDALKASEKRKKREEIKKNMLDLYKDDGIDMLAIANMNSAGDVVKIEQK
jgi:hypothetical protein